MAVVLWLAVSVVEGVFAVLLLATIVAGFEKMEQERAQASFLCLCMMVLWLAVMLCIYAAARGLLS